MVEILSLKDIFPFKIAQKIEKEVRNLASDPTPLLKLLLNQLNVIRAAG